MTNDDITKALATPMAEVLGKQGITADYLSKKLKRELNAKVEKVFHEKGTIHYSKSMIDWSTRQKAREDAQKLLGLYPADKHEVTFPAGLTVGEMTDEERKVAKTVAKLFAQQQIQGLRNGE